MNKWYNKTSKEKSAAILEASQLFPQSMMKDNIADLVLEIEETDESNLDVCRVLMLGNIEEWKDDNDKKKIKALLCGE